MSTHLPTEMEAIEASTDPAWLAGQLGFASAARLRTAPVPEPEKAAPRPAKKALPPCKGGKHTAAAKGKMIIGHMSSSHSQKSREVWAKNFGRRIRQATAGLDPDFDEGF